MINSGPFQIYKAIKAENLVDSKTLSYTEMLDRLLVSPNGLLLLESVSKLTLIVIFCSIHDLHTN